MPRRTVHLSRLPEGHFFEYDDEEYVVLSRYWSRAANLLDYTTVTLEPTTPVVPLHAILFAVCDLEDLPE